MVIALSMTISEYPGQKLIIIMASHGVLQCHMRALQAFRALLIGLRLVLERPVQALRALFNASMVFECCSMVFEWYYVVLRCSPAPHKVLYRLSRCC